jgi:hypothetical protein
MPTTRPRRSTSGPPLLPGLIDASSARRSSATPGLQLPRHRADHTERHRSCACQGTAEREHELPRPQVVGVAEGERRQLGLVDLDDGKIGLMSMR